MSEVRRYAIDGYGMVERSDGAWYYADDYDQIKAENEWLAHELKKAHMAEREIFAYAIELRTQLDEARELLSKALNNIPPNFALSKRICKWLECTETRAIQTPVQVVDLRPKPISNTYHIAEALDALIKNYDSEIHSEHDGTSMLDSRLSKINFAREALAAYRAAKVNEE